MTAHGGVEFAGETPGLIDMVQHQLAHLRGIATSRRCQKLRALTIFCGNLSEYLIVHSWELEIFY